VTVSGFTDPSFFAFFTVFAFAMFLNLLSSFIFLLPTFQASAIDAPNFRLEMSLSNP